MVRPGTRGCFITGTDTGVGKTLVCRALIAAFIDKGRRVAAMKPVASGTENINGRARNEDAVLLREAINVDLPYDTLNPYALESPVAPAVAAAAQGVSIDPQRILQACQHASAMADVIVVEGVGGWRIGLGGGLQMSDVAAMLGLPVLLVVGMRLGCINHALLTAEAITRDGCRLAGWIANFIDPGYLEPELSLQHLEACLDAPLLASVPTLQGQAMGPAISVLSGLQCDEIGL